jgi:hypothetical protein
MFGSFNVRFASILTIPIDLHTSETGKPLRHGGVATNFSTDWMSIMQDCDEFDYGVA